MLEPKRLAISTKQEFDNFTVGGSIAANIHGKSIDYGPIISHVLSLRLLKADGEIVTASRTQNPDLFTGVIGGYGLLGVVVDVTFQPPQRRARFPFRRDHPAICSRTAHTAPVSSLPRPIAIAAL